MLTIPIYDGNKFSYDSSTKTFTSEISTLNPCGQLHKRIWHDSCDVGFFILSPKTGKKMLFIWYNHIQDRDGEFQGHKYQSKCGLYHIMVFGT